MINVGDFLFPNLGSHFDPRVASTVTWAIAGIVRLVWGPSLLGRRWPAGGG